MGAWSCCHSVVSGGKEDSSVPVAVVLFANEERARAEMSAAMFQYFREETFGLPAEQRGRGGV